MPCGVSTAAGVRRRVARLTDGRGMRRDGDGVMAAPEYRQHSQSDHGHGASGRGRGAADRVCGAAVGSIGTYALAAPVVVGLNAAATADMGPHGATVTDVGTDVDHDAERPFTRGLTVRQ
jgi:hypothetical protein